MREPRFINIIVIIFIFATGALIYVHQEVEIVKTGVCINKNRQKVSLLLDQYRSLVYNLSQLESPRRIEDTLCVKETTLCMPKRENIRYSERVSLARSKEVEKANTKPAFLAHIFDRFSTKAEAKVVK